MNKPRLDRHISKRFNAELEALRTKVLTTGGRVEKQLEDALIALTERNDMLAERVITEDYKINALEVEIDEDCIGILARRQPAASDLRLIMAVIKTITDLERMGDEAVRIAKMAAHLARQDQPAQPLVQVRHLGNQVRQMLNEALDAFARMDVELAGKIVAQDPRVDLEYESIVRQLITYMMEDPRAIPRSLDVLWSARSLERIGDRVCNICEYVIYLVRGRDVRHTSLEQVRKEAGYTD